MNSKTRNVASALCCILLLVVLCAPRETREQISTRKKDAVRKQLRKEASFDFIATPLPDVLAYISHWTGVPLVLDDEHVQDAHELEVTLRLENVHADDALKWALRLVALDYVVREHDVLVTTRDEAWWDGRAPVERAYSVEKLIDPKSKASDFANFIKSVITVDTWGKKGTGIKAKDGTLIVVHIPKVHAQIRELLASFEEARNRKKRGIVEPLPPPPPFRVEGLTDEELLNVCSATLLGMLKNAGDWDQKIERRFVSALGHAHKALFARLRKAGFKVQSPYVKDPAYTDGRFIKGRHLPKGDTSLFYYITNVGKITVDDEWEVVPNPDGGGMLLRPNRSSKIQVIVLCRVIWHGLAGRGYRYVFEKRKGKWVIDRVEMTWES